MAAETYLPRLVDRRIEQLFAELPALMLTGPRAAGKTTTGRRHAQTIVRLDREAEAIAFRADPDAALSALVEPVLLDEWQAVPGVLAAVKRAIDEEPRAGRFLLTGSVQADLLGETWPGTGRVVRIRMDGLTMRELEGATAAPPFLERLAAASVDSFALPREVPDLRDYVRLALRGGFPEPALRLSPDVGRAWLAGYVDQLLTRDVDLLADVRDPDRLRRYFEAVALNTAGLPDHKTLYDAAGITRKTAVAYDQLLTNLFVLESLPAWTSNRLKRLVKGAKRHLVDPSLAGAALRVDEAAVMRDGDLLGRLIETFVLAQVRPELELLPGGARPFHLRDVDGRRELDLLVELPGGDVVAIEVKATAAPGLSDARHLAWLRDALGDRFLGGAVLHTGPAMFPLSERIAAVPICALWGS